VNNVVVYGAWGGVSLDLAVKMMHHYEMNRIIDAQEFRDNLESGETMALSGWLILDPSKDMPTSWVPLAGRILPLQLALKDIEG
jgi:hypothetical protein